MTKETLIETLRAAQSAAVNSDPVAMQEHLREIARAGGVPGAEAHTARFEQSCRNVLRGLRQTWAEQPAALAVGITHEQAIIDSICCAFIERDCRDPWPMAGGRHMARFMLGNAIALIG